MCVRMVYTLKTNRHPIATAREMDVGLDELGDEGGREEWRGEKEGGIEARTRGCMRQRKRGERKEGAS